MELKKVTGKSKKTGKEWTGYVVKIGRYQTPVFFPTEVELWYIDQYMSKLEEDITRDKSGIVE